MIASASSAPLPSAPASSSAPLPSTPFHRKKIEVVKGKAYIVSAKPCSHLSADAQWVVLVHFRKLGDADDAQSFKSLYLQRGTHGWHGHIAIPDDAPVAEVAIYSFGTRVGRHAEWEIEVKETASANRALVLGVVHQVHPENPTLESNRDLIINAIEEAALQKVDLLCTSELFLSRGVDAAVGSLAVASDSPLLEPIYEAVRRAKIHFVFCYQEAQDERVYNTALLISPEGQIIGCYRKTRLTFSEHSKGLTQGDELPVFDTPLGKIGLLICWDGWFPETALALARKGAEIICYPIAGDGNEKHWEHVWPARAMDNQVFWMASVTGNCGGNAPSRILSPDGACLAQTREANGLATAQIQLPHSTEVHWLSLGPCWAERGNVIRHEIAESARQPAKVSLR